MAARVHFLGCDSAHYKKNGRIHTGKQNHGCKDFGQQFVFHPEHRLIDAHERATIQRLLAKRVSLHGICRLMRVSLTFDLAG